MKRKEIIKKKLNKIREKFNRKNRSEKEKKIYKESMIAINKHFHKREYNEVDKILWIPGIIHGHLEGMHKSNNMMMLKWR